MIFIDSNVPMYLVGAEHPHKRTVWLTLEKLVSERRRLVTSAEVFQEILHRYVAIGRRDAVAPTVKILQDLVDEVFPVEIQDIHTAQKFLAEHLDLSARDALHAAHLKRHGIATILSFDKGFDRLNFVTRLP